MHTPPMSPRHPMSRPERARGFTLVEVLVAVLVVSIGLLGVARLVLAAVKANDSAYFRTQAADLAYSMLDEIRANREYAITTSGYDASPGTVGSPGNCLNVTPVCTPQEMANYQIYNWEQLLATGGVLPNGKGYIKITPSTGPGVLPTATITVTWDDSIAQEAFVPGTSTTSSTGGGPATPSTTGTFTLETAL